MLERELVKTNAQRWLRRATGAPAATLEPTRTRSIERRRCGTRRARRSIVMSLAKKKLITIIVPDSAEDELIAALASITRGLSVVPARGRGAHGERPNLWRSGNVQVEAIVAPSDVEPIVAVLERFVEDMPCVAWIADVEAWPAKKFA